VGVESLLLRAFCLTVMAAGWYYLFYSRAAQKLSAIEVGPVNVWRVRLRRVGGLVIMLLGTSLYVGMFGVGWDPPTKAFAAVWLFVFVLLAAAVVLAMVDVLLTRQLRGQRRNSEDQRQ
jgi:hypothetical protein